MAERLTPEQLNELVGEYDPKRADWCGNDRLHMGCGGCAYKVAAQAARDARTLQRVQAWTEFERGPVTPGPFVTRRGHHPQYADAQDQVAALLRAEED